MRRKNDEWVRQPGLFRRHEIKLFVDPDRELLVEFAGLDAQGGDLFRLFHRPRRVRSEDLGATGPGANI